MNTPLVSVIMPAYNTSNFIAEAIDSVIKQTWAHWELIIIDDVSTDDTVEVVNSFSAKEDRIHLIKNLSNKGPGVARNLGIEKAKGSFIAFLDSDDQWLPYKLETQIGFMQQNDLEMSFSSYYLLKENEEQPFAIVQAPEVLTYRKLLKSNYVGNLTGIYDVAKIGKVFAPEIRKRQDWALWLTILKNKGETRAISRPLAVYRVRKESLSKNKTALIAYNYRIYRNFLNFGFLKSCFFMGRFLWEHFIIKRKQVKLLDKGSKLL
ncbi:glycosyltransferase family 2 protein [Antarcticibacterium arcticum]|uniref:Glycosyltransferase family 2 protein n=2 Tax=Antarcticibacterium arcticum TaxID=2585771 RepID=A0A5B8YPD5_9FLAO|nr:glycosyltransferase family 2 protein [Antarcticibacterium arcticum]